MRRTDRCSLLAMFYARLNWRPGTSVRSMEQLAGQRPAKSINILVAPKMTPDRFGELEFRPTAAIAVDKPLPAADRIDRMFVAPAGDRGYGDDRLSCDSPQHIVTSRSLGLVHTMMRSLLPAPAPIC
jgi:hypothetical protein